VSTAPEAAFRHTWQASRVIAKMRECSSVNPIGATALLTKIPLLANPEKPAQR
jgi:hypothetical protein